MVGYKKIIISLYPALRIVDCLEGVCREVGCRSRRHDLGLLLDQCYKTIFADFECNTRLPQNNDKTLWSLNI